jgi:hypothetical protein
MLSVNERVFSPQEVRQIGLAKLMAQNNAGRRMQRGGYLQKGGQVRYLFDGGYAAEDFNDLETYKFVYQSDRAKRDGEPPKEIEIVVRGKQGHNIVDDNTGKTYTPSKIIGEVSKRDLLSGDWEKIKNPPVLMLEPQKEADIYFNRPNEAHSVEASYIDPVQPTKERPNRQAQRPSSDIASDIRWKKGSIDKFGVDNVIKETGRQQAIQSVTALKDDYRLFMVGNKDEYAALPKPTLLQFLRGTQDPDRFKSIVPISVSRAMKDRGLQQMFFGHIQKAVKESGYVPDDPKIIAESMRQVRELTTEPLSTKSLIGAGRDIFAEDLRNTINGHIGLIGEYIKNADMIEKVSPEYLQRKYGDMTPQEWFTRLQDIKRSSGLRDAFDIIHWDNDISRDIRRTVYNTMNKHFRDDGASANKYIDTLSKIQNEPTNIGLLKASGTRRAIQARNNLLDLIRQPRDLTISMGIYGKAVYEQPKGISRTEFVQQVERGEINPCTPLQICKGCNTRKCC